MASLNFLEKVRRHHTQLIELAEGQEDLTQSIDIFFNTYIFNIKHYQQILKLFLNRLLTAEEEQAKQAIISEYKKISCAGNFQFDFIHSIFIENSFLAFSTDQHPLIQKMINGVLLGESPYAVVQLNFIKTHDRLSLLNEYLTPQLLGFNIGNDLTWKMTVSEQHTSEKSITIHAQSREYTKLGITPTPTISVKNTTSHPLPIKASTGKNEQNAQVTVNKLSKLSKNYLAHLNKTANKKNIQQKYDLILELIAILDHTSNSPITKLLEFSSRLQEVDKVILKNHREPNWIIFKKAALFLLGITVVGAIGGLIDYALRGHHSIFCTAKSHGERFILDVEQYIPKENTNHTV